MFLPSYSLPFSRSVLLMKGLLSLGLPSPAETPLGQPGSPRPGQRCESSHPQAAAAARRGGTPAPVGGHHARAQDR